MVNYKNKKWLYHQYCVEGRNSYEIAELQGCSSTTIINWLRRYGIATKKRSDYKKVDIDESTLRKLYLEDKKSISDVSNLLHVCDNTVIKYLRKYGIKSRRVSDYPSFVQGHIRGRKKLIGRHRSLETRIKISKSKTLGEWEGFASKDSVYRQHAQTPEYRNWRQDIFKRDQFTCQECGVYSGSLELHHIIPLRDYPEGIMESSNAITLCLECHNITKKREYEFVDRFNAVVGRL